MQSHLSSSVLENRSRITEADLDLLVRAAFWVPGLQAWAVTTGVCSAVDWPLARSLPNDYTSDPSVLVFFSDTRSPSNSKADLENVHVAAINRNVVRMGMSVVLLPYTLLFCDLFLISDNWPSPPYSAKKTRAICSQTGMDTPALLGNKIRHNF